MIKLSLEDRIYYNTGTSYNILAEDDNYYLVFNEGLREYLIIDKEGYRKSQFNFEPYKDPIRANDYRGSMRERSYLEIDKIGEPIEYEYWFNPPYMIKKGQKVEDMSKSTLKFKEFKDKVEIYSFAAHLSHPMEIKFTLRLPTEPFKQQREQ